MFKLSGEGRSMSGLVNEYNLSCKYFLTYKRPMESTVLWWACSHLFLEARSLHLYYTDNNHGVLLNCPFVLFWLFISTEMKATQKYWTHGLNRLHLYNICKENTFGQWSFKLPGPPVSCPGWWPNYASFLKHTILYWVLIMLHFI